MRLQGPPGNPSGIGAVIRLQFGQRLGPARECMPGRGIGPRTVPCGAGLSREPTQIWVRWPGGRMTQSALPPGAQAVLVEASGKVTLAH